MFYIDEAAIQRRTSEARVAAKKFFLKRKRRQSYTVKLHGLEVFHVLHEAYLAIGHRGRERMSKELSTKYKGVTRHNIELYNHLLEPCKKIGSS
ncbi:hypothetical protein TNCV_4543591 [Trichonephila clavipes]|nr:hypothetical protein TNCV_4543591 [Trichonephila clavipes]